MTRSGEEDRVHVVLANETIEVRVHEVQPRRRPPVAEKARLDVLGAERLAEERVCLQVDLPHREIVRGAKVGVERTQVVGGDGHDVVVPHSNHEIVSTA